MTRSLVGGLIVMTAVAVLPSSAEAWGRQRAHRHAPRLNVPGGLRLEVETAPVAWALSGASLHVGVKVPRALPVEATLGYLELEMPDRLLEERNPGYHAHVRAAILAVGVSRHPLVRGVSVGGAIVVTHTTWTHDDAPGERDTRIELAIGPYLSWQWFPFLRGLYIRPHAMVGLRVAPFDEAPTLGGQQLDERRVFKYLGVHVGWELVPRATRRSRRR